MFFSACIIEVDNKQLLNCNIKFAAYIIGWSEKKFFLTSRGGPISFKLNFDLKFFVDKNKLFLVYTLCIYIKISEC